ncbi:MAG: ribonuclease P protein component [Bacteroidaceae bacterium]
MFSFKKSERITSLKDTDALFDKQHGSVGISAFPLRAIYRKVPLPDNSTTIPCEPIKVLVSVAKKRLHHAVDRNRAKRQIREAYRLQKLPLKETLLTLPADNQYSLHIAFLWLSNTPQPSQLVAKSMKRILTTINNKLTADETTV